MLKRYLLTWPIALLMAAGCQGTVLPAGTIVSKLETANNKLNAIENDLSRNRMNNSEAYYLSTKVKEVQGTCDQFVEALNSAIVKFKNSALADKNTYIGYAKSVRKEVRKLRSDIPKTRNNTIIYIGLSIAANMDTCIFNHMKAYKSAYDKLVGKLRSMQ